MNKRLENILRNLSDHDLPKWFGQKTISRGRGYLNDVHEIVAMENGGVAAKVKGTHEYLAAITIDDDGNVEMECTCPVGIECKHCVALAMKCHELLLDGKRIKTLPPSDSYWRDLKFKFGEELSIFGESVPIYDDEREVIAAIRKMKYGDLKMLVEDLLENVPESLSYLAHKFVMESASADLVLKNAHEAIDDATQNGYDYWEYHGRGRYYDDDYDDAPDYSKVREYFERIAKLGKIKELMKLCDYFVSRCEEQLEVSNDEGEMLSDMQDCVEVVAHAVFKSGLSDAEKLTWEYSRQTNDEFPFLESDYDQSLTYWNNEKISADEWGKVANRIIVNCKSVLKDDYALSRHWRYLSTALHNAGRGKEVVDMAIALSASPEGYQRVVAALHIENRIPEAIEWCKKAIVEYGRNDWEREKFVHWLRRFAADREDWPVVAAYDVARFLKSPSIEGFLQLKESCTKAKVWKSARTVLVKSLADGSQPLQSDKWPLPIPEYADAILDEKKCPRSELLCRIALHEKDADSAIAWFEKLVSHKTWDATLNHVWQNEHLAFSVAEEIASKLPDSSIKIWRMIIEENCLTAGEHHYETIVCTLKKMKPVMIKCGIVSDWHKLIADLKEIYRRRRNLVQKLEKLK